MLINKGSSFGWAPEQLEKSKDALGLTLISVLTSIRKSWNIEPSVKEGDDTVSPKNKGLIIEAFEAMYHDLHGLSIQIDMIKHFFDHKNGITRHRDFLFVTEVIEKYFANMRSIYDFMSKLLMLSVDQKLLGQINFDSLNSLITSVEKGKTKGKLTSDLEKALLEIKPSFHALRDIRDFIIHNGKQLKIMTDENEYLIENFMKKEKSDDYVPLLPYLSHITKEMLIFGEVIAHIIYEQYTKRYGEVPYFLVALEGVCIPSFIDFLGLFESETESS
ncbi:hypothetical protein AB3Z07_27045 (plasmid) [Metabacillus halosaccharovorans]|uniref:hypothetical protein n=1 Tax=Metabacillus TaxID=2675233 RepID=UPI000C7FB5D5|nr:MULTISPECIES: hypothetical protein [Metabacillus]MCM3443346.1 hypothetical protein [Metabacillus halosaccharovorans]PMC34637.1 hypothetical protein CJ195_22785 [Bacillus sp. UMB0899]